MPSTTSAGSLLVQGVTQMSATLAQQGTATSTTLAAPKTNISTPSQVSFAYGTGAGQCDTFVCQDRTLAAGASETLDLSDGSVLDVFGSPAGLATIKFISVSLIANPDASTASSGATIGNAASNAHTLWLGGTTPTVTLNAGGVPLQQGDGTGKAVDATHCNLKILNNDAANKLTYRIQVAGVHA